METISESAPRDIAEPLRVELSNNAIRVKIGEATLCDIWFRKTIPSEPGSGIGRSYPNMPDTTLLGAIRVTSPMHDNRNNNFPVGVYTIRHGIQPQDGNHAGSTPFIDFALLLRAQTDSIVDGGFPNSMAMIRRSMSDGGTGHPLVFALLPASNPGRTGIAKNEEDRWVLETKVGDLPLAIVLIGVYEH